MTFEAVPSPEGSRSYTIDLERFQGFTKKKARFFQRLLEAAGLPLDNVHLVECDPSDEAAQKRGSVGSARRTNLNLHHKDTIKLHYNFERIGHIFDVFLKWSHGIVVHELAHINSPFYKVNGALYGGDEARVEVCERVRGIVQQTLTTGKYLNGYHKKLVRSYQSGTPMKGTEKPVSLKKLEEETHAILVQERYMNPRHLRQVQEAQRSKLKKLGKEADFVPLLSEEGSNEPAGVDKTLLALTPDSIQTLNDLDRHIADFRRLRLRDMLAA